MKYWPGPLPPANKDMRYWLRHPDDNSTTIKSTDDKMTDTESTTRPPKFLRKYRAHLLWFLLISVYLYWTLLPEVIFVNGSGTTIEQLKIIIPTDDKIWRNIEHGSSKAFRYQPSSRSGQYKISIILSDGSLIRGNFDAITQWNLGHKAIIELSPDLNLRADFSLSLID